MGHFFPTMGEVRISFHDSRNKSVSYEMSHEANHMYFSCLISVRIDISSSVKTGRHYQWGSSMLHMLHLWAQFRRQLLSMSHWALLLCDKDNSNQRLHRACTGGPLHVQTSVVHRTWRHCCFSSPPRLTFGTGVDRCDDSAGHNCGCHLVALWAFKGGGNWCQYNLSLSQWVVSLPLAIGRVNNLTQRRSCWCSMHMTM